MPCGICKENGHTAVTCQSPIIEEKTSQMFRQITDSTLNCMVNDFQSLNRKQVIPMHMVNSFTEEDLRMLRPRPGDNLDELKQQMIRKRNLGLRKMQGRIINNVSSMFRNSRTSDVQWSTGLLKRVCNNFDRLFHEKYPDSYTAVNRREIADIPAITNHQIKTKIARMVYSIFETIIKPNYLDYSNVSAEELIPPPPGWQQRLHQDLERHARQLILIGVDGINNWQNNMVDIVSRQVLRLQTNMDIMRRQHARELRAARNNASVRVNHVATRKEKIKFKMDNNDSKYICDDSCYVCMEEMKPSDMVAMTCGHAFCSGCTGQFINKCNGKCPVCRSKIEEVRFRPDIQPERFNNIVVALSN